MRKYVEELKPKANKLLSFVSNWQLATHDKNIELSLSISSLIGRGIFPAPIRSFFSLPQFQKLLSTMKQEGKLFIIPQKVDKENDEPYPTLEVQNIQIMIEGLHRLVHLDYNRQQIKEPSVQAKVLGDNILDYLSAAEMFLFSSAFEGKIADEIMDYLFTSLRKQSERLKDVILKNKGFFSHQLIDLIEKPIFSILLLVDRKSYMISMIEEWHPILVELNIDAKLSHLSTQLESLTIANAHKLINQMKTLIESKGQFYQRNTPRYIPKKLKEEVLENIKIVSNGQPLLGEKINQLFMNEFGGDKYEVIEARESGIHNKFLALAQQVWPIKKSLTTLIVRFNNLLPNHFCTYFNQALSPFSNMLKIFGKPNHLAVQLVCGFYTSQLDYLTDLLFSEEPTSHESNLLAEIENLMPMIHSFLESYYAHRPIASFKTIKTILETMFQGEHALESYPVEIIEKKIHEAFSYLIPLETSAFHSLEDSLDMILIAISSISKKLPQNSMEGIMLRTILNELTLLDLPSFSQSWYSFGRLLSALFTIVSKQDPHFKNSIEISISRFFEARFFQIMFFQS